jgi:hypothetical protein
MFYYLFEVEIGQPGIGRLNVSATRLYIDCAMLPLRN